MIETLKFPDETIIQAEISRSGNFCTIRNPSAGLPADTSQIQIISDAGDVYGILSNYSTIYRQLENEIILSNDGSVYVEPEPVPPYTPTLEELKQAKKAQMSAECQQTIYAGVTVDLPAGSERFSLKQEDQINLFGKQAQLAAGETQLEYHQDNHPCRYYTAAEMQQIITAAMQWVSYHTTYCNSLYTWINAATAADDLDDITYGADIPAAYQSDVLKNYLAQIQEEADAVTV